MVKKLTYKPIHRRRFSPIFPLAVFRAASQVTVRLKEANW